MKRLLGVCLIVCALAVTAAFAQTPTPAPAWNEANLTWPAPTDFANGGGSLASCATGPCGVTYIVEASAPGGNGWGPIAIVDVTNYKATGLWPGLWQFRIKAFFRLTGYSPPSPVVSKTIVEPVSTAPPAPVVQ